MIYSDSLEWKLAQALISRRNNYERMSRGRLEIDVGINKLNLTATLLETQEFLFKSAENDDARYFILGHNPYLHKTFVEAILKSGQIRHLGVLATNTTVVMKHSSSSVEEVSAPVVQQKTTTTPTTASKIADWVINLRNEANVAEEILESAVAVSIPGASD